jgi:hypothetical protein
MAYWAEVFEVRMNSGGIVQKGVRGGEKDGEIGIRVVVVLAFEGGVDRCHDLDCERLTRGRNEANTPLWENCENQQQQRTTTVTVLTI